MKKAFYLTHIPALITLLAAFSSASGAVQNLAAQTEENNFLWQPALQRQLQDLLQDSWQDPWEESHTLKRFDLIRQKKVTLLAACQKDLLLALVPTSKPPKSTEQTSPSSQILLWSSAQSHLQTLSTPLAENTKLHAVFSPDCQQILLWSRSKVRPLLFHRKTGQYQKLPLSDQLVIANAFFEDQQLLHLAAYQEYKKTLLFRYSYNDKKNQFRKIFEAPFLFQIQKDPDSKGLPLLRGNFGLARLLPSGQLEDIHPRPNTLYLGNNQVLITEGNHAAQNSRIKLALLNGRTLLSIPGSQPQRVNSESFVFQRLSGSDERVLFLYHLPSQQTFRLTHPHRVGHSRARTLDGKIYAEFDGGFEKNTLIHYETKRHSSLYNSQPGIPEIAEKIIYRRPYTQQEVSVNPQIIRSSDGFRYPAYHYSLRSVLPRGLIVYIQGGGCYSSIPYRSSLLRPEFYDVLQAGYQILAISYRNNDFAAPPYQPKPWTKEDCGKKEIEDILAAARNLRDLHPHLPIFIWGHSQGAYLTNLAITKYAHLFNWAGAISGAGMWAYTDEHATTFMSRYYHPARAPIRYLHKLKTPLYVYHGQKDQQVGFGHSKLLMHRLNLIPEPEIDSLMGSEILEYYQHPHRNIEIYSPKNEDHKIRGWNQYQTWIHQLLRFLRRNERTDIGHHGRS